MSSRPISEWSNALLMKEAERLGLEFNEINDDRGWLQNEIRKKYEDNNQLRTRRQTNWNREQNRRQESEDRVRAESNAQNEFNEERRLEAEERQAWEDARNNNESDPAIKTIASSAGTTRGQLITAVKQFPPTRRQRAMPYINRNNGEKTWSTNPRTGEKQFRSTVYLRDDEAEPKRVYEKRLEGDIEYFEKTNLLTPKEAAIKILEYGGYPKSAKELNDQGIKKIRKKLANELGISLDLEQEWTNNDGKRKITPRKEENREIFVPSKKLQEIMNKIKPNNNASASAPATNNKPVAKKTAAKKPPARNTTNKKPTTKKKTTAKKPTANKAAKNAAANKAANKAAKNAEETSKMKQRNTVLHSLMDLQVIYYINQQFSFLFLMTKYLHLK